MNTLKFSGFMCMIFGTFMTYAQNTQGKEKLKDKINVQKVAYITNQLQLSESEAQKFWPLYNAYQAEIQQLKSSLDVSSKNEMNDKESEDMLMGMLDGRFKEIEIQKKYIQKFKSAISPKKIVLLYKAEKQFKEKIISNIRERQQKRIRS